MWLRGAMTSAPFFRRAPQRTFLPSVVALILADLLVMHEIVAQDEGSDRLLGHHVAAVLGYHFEDINEIFDMRSQLTRDGLWEESPSPEGEVATAKRVSEAGRALGATVQASQSADGYRAILGKMFTASGRPINAKASTRSKQQKPGRRKEKNHRERERLLLETLGDHLWVQERVGDWSTIVSDRIFQERFPGKTNAGSTNRAAFKRNGYLASKRSKNNALLWRVTPKGIAHLEARGIVSTLTEQDLFRFIDSSLSPSSA